MTGVLSGVPGPWLCLVIALAVMLGMARAPVGMLLSHGPAAAGHHHHHHHVAGGHDDLAHVQDGDQDGDHSRAAKSGDAHGHNSANHTHEVSTVPPVIASFSMPAGRSWAMPSPVIPEMEARFRLDRPPKSRTGASIVAAGQDAIGLGRRA